MPTTTPSCSLTLANLTVCRSVRLSSHLVYCTTRAIKCKWNLTADTVHILVFQPMYAFRFWLRWNSCTIRIFINYNNINSFECIQSGSIVCFLFRYYYNIFFLVNDDYDAIAALECVVLMLLKIFNFKV